MKTQITTDTHTRDGSFVFGSLSTFLIRRISFYEYTLSLQIPLSLPRDVRSDLKEAEQKYQCAICENKQKKKPKNCSILLLSFFFLSSHHFIIMTIIIVSLYSTLRRQTFLFCFSFCREVRTKSNSHFSGYKFLEKKSSREWKDKKRNKKLVKNIFFI